MRWLSRCVAILCALAGTAIARPGGGHSFSSGHSSGGHSFSGGGYHGSYYGGGGSSDGGELVIFGIVVAILVIAALVKAVSRQSAANWSSDAAAELAPVIAPPVNLAAVVAADPDFSRAVFEDFAYQLYAAAQRARADQQQLLRLAAYLSPNATAALAARGAPVQQVVVGAMHITAATVGSAQQMIRVRFESNLAGSGGTIAAVETWSFARALGTRSKPPVRTHTWPCPNCGAPWSAQDGSPRTCGHCGQATQAGQFDWVVSAIAVESETSIGPTLTGTVDEVGNDFPTVVDPRAQAMFASLTADDPAVSWQALVPRIAMIYARLNEAWNAGDLAPARGLVTHAMQDYLRFWLEEYRHQSLANRLDDARITNTQLAKVVRDRYYDAITVRVFADGLDYTVDARGRVVGGSREKRRAYTEYWTFLRSSARRGPIVGTPACPNCGAPLQITDAGACTHCNAEIESGSFDWVLSKIEQDDVYTG